MDKANRAMFVAEDNIERINAMWYKLPLRKVLSGADASGRTSFGNVKLLSPTAVVAVFDGEACSLEFCGETVGSGASPVVAVLPVGDGALELSASRSGAKALLI